MKFTATALLVLLTVQFSPAGKQKIILRLRDPLKAETVKVLVPELTNGRGETRDLEAKVERAMSLRGARYLHVLVPCPLGWGSEPAKTVKLARLAQRSGLFPVFEAEHGEVTSALPIRGRVPVEDYLRPQKRYAHLFGDLPRADILAALQAIADRNITRYGLLPEET